MADPAQPQMHVSVTVEGVPELLARIPDAAKRRAVSRRILSRLALLVQAEAMKRSPVRTGTLRRSWNVTVSPAGDEAVVASTLRYAPYVEYGTGLFGPRHQRITSPSGKVLAWPAGNTGPNGTLRQTGSPRAGTQGQYAFARSTQGMHPHPMLHPALEAAMPHAPEVLQEAARLLLTPGMAA